MCENETCVRKQKCAVFDLFSSGFESGTWIFNNILYKKTETQTNYGTFQLAVQYRQMNYVDMYSYEQNFRNLQPGTWDKTCSKYSK